MGVYSWFGILAVHIMISLLPSTVQEDPGQLRSYLTDDADLQSRVHVSSGPDGRLHVVWRNYLNGYAVYKTRFTTGLWSPEIKITPLFYANAMDISGGFDGQAHYIQPVEINFGYYNIHYFLLDQPQISDSYYTQTVTVPANMHKPTLSFMHKSVYTPDPATLNVLINDQIVNSTSPSESNWNLNWVDLVDWSGQTIEIKFQSQSDITMGLSTIDIDDVSLGSNTMPRIDQISPSIITTNWNGQFVTVTGDNFIDPVTAFLDGINMTNITYVSDTSILIELPADFPPGLYDLTIINPQGQEAVLSRALWLGQPFFLPIIRR